MSLLDIARPTVEQPAGRLPAPGEPRWKRLAAALTGLWLLTSVYIVRTDEQAVVTRFGAVVEPRVMPGIHIGLPWPVDRATRLKVQQLQRLVIGGDPADAVLGRSQPLLSQFFTGDQNIIHMRVIAQYSVGVPADYLFQSQNAATATGAAVESELARKVARRTVDAILTTEKAAVQEEVRAAAQKLLNDWRAGVLLSTINIESVTAPPEAATAFRDVAGARADQARIVNQAQGYANDVIPKARGEARQSLESAAAYKESKINEASGDAARFTQVAREYAKAADVTGERLYQEAMAEVLPRIKKLIVDKSGNLDLTIVRKSDPQTK